KKTPLSSMSPTIVTRDGKPFMVIVSPGGSRIITITLEAILNFVDFGMDISQAVNAPLLPRPTGLSCRARQCSNEGRGP
ncbi:gamma-glutamyltransferase, partial [Rhizobium leguminosarum]|uniref:gamma-glutamyltransferase n=1 Tax=Rhizobium leguminosarum TaxID=384 RepID=UPI003F9A2C03